ncbi:MAG TPA: A/G-specific adenine glycosylase [Clostridia bacterium]|nr:A/G-specific adenine glycosylase [Clostridia bacterium]
MPEKLDISAPELRRLRSRLLRWYAENHRDLPWRRTQVPYRIWVSEIMLQQTRVNAVLEHYALFLSAFPTVQALAKADLSSVLAVWSGLGYYRRARAMHECAKVLVQDFCGELPRTPEELAKLPGIGKYTSAAIASIAFEHDSAVVDGNVERVLTRMFALQTPSAGMFAELAQSLLHARHAGNWNQAMMELGATVCTPAQPHCQACPLRAWCKLPGGVPARPQPARQRKQVAYGLARKADRVYLVRRSESSGLMPGMWELPAIVRRNGERVLAKHKHSITNTDYEVTVVELPRAQGTGKWIRAERLLQLPLTGLTRKVLRKAGVILQQ